LGIPKQGSIVAAVEALVITRTSNRPCTSVSSRIAAADGMAGLERATPLADELGAQH